MSPGWGRGAGRGRGRRARAGARGGDLEIWNQQRLRALLIRQRLAAAATAATCALAVTLVDRALVRRAERLARLEHCGALGDRSRVLQALRGSRARGPRRRSGAVPSLGVAARPSGGLAAEARCAAAAAGGRWGGRWRGPVWPLGAR